ncbi:hypothetical protein DVH05_005343 [Phytophthora capsici]|nr:hypothetical protein DVH05_005343 [Phytophthora capsici]
MLANCYVLVDVIVVSCGGDVLCFCRRVVLPVECVAVLWARGGWLCDCGCLAAELAVRRLTMWRAGVLSDEGTYRPADGLCGAALRAYVGAVYVAAE